MIQNNLFLNKKRLFNIILIPQRTTSNCFFVRLWIFNKIFVLNSKIFFQVLFQEVAPTLMIYNVKISDLDFTKVIVWIFERFLILWLVKVTSKIPFFKWNIPGYVLASIYRHCFCYISEQKNSGSHSAVLLNYGFSSSHKNNSQSAVHTQSTKYLQ